MYSSLQTLIVRVAGFGQSDFPRAWTNSLDCFQLSGMNPILSIHHLLFCELCCDLQTSGWVGRCIAPWDTVFKQKQHLCFYRVLQTDYTQTGLCSLLSWVPIKLYIHLGAHMPCFSALKLPPGLWIVTAHIWPFDSKTFRRDKGRAIWWEQIECLWQHRVEIRVSLDGRSQKRCTCSSSRVRLPFLPSMPFDYCLVWAAWHALALHSLGQPRGKLRGNRKKRGYWKQVTSELIGIYQMTG